MEDPDHAVWQAGLNSHDVDNVALPDAQSTAVEPVRRVDSKFTSSIIRCVIDPC